VNVSFRKTGARRYGVWVERELAPALMMDPAPGFDEFLPHDLLHFVAEAEWGLDGAVFGRLASGADAGTFWPVDQALVRKAMRRRKKTRVRPRGRRSELLAGILEEAWHSRRGRRPLPDDWADRLTAARAEAADVERIVSSLDDLAERWHALHLGEALELEWPRPEGRRRPTAAAPRRRRSAGRRRPAPRA
jgi:hypothetical protein